MTLTHTEEERESEWRAHMEVGESLFLPKVAVESDQIKVLESFGSSEQRGEDERDSVLREREATFRAVQSETEAVLSSTPYWRK